jgi:hypothetical protein
MHERAVGKLFVKRPSRLIFMVLSAVFACSFADAADNEITPVESRPVISPPPTLQIAIAALICPNVRNSPNPQRTAAAIVMCQPALRSAYIKAVADLRSANAIKRHAVEMKGVYDYTFMRGAELDYTLTLANLTLTEDAIPRLERQANCSAAAVAQLSGCRCNPISLTTTFTDVVLSMTPEEIRSEISRQCWADRCRIESLLLSYLNEDARLQKLIQNGQVSADRAFEVADRGMRVGTNRPSDTNLASEVAHKVATEVITRQAARDCAMLNLEAAFGRQLFVEK